MLSISVCVCLCSVCFLFSWNVICVYALHEQGDIKYILHAFIVLILKQAKKIQVSLQSQCVCVSVWRVHELYLNLRHEINIFYVNDSLGYSHEDPNHIRDCDHCMRACGSNRCVWVCQFLRLLQLISQANMHSITPVTWIYDWTREIDTHKHTPPIY